LSCPPPINQPQVRGQANAESILRRTKTTLRKMALKTTRRRKRRRRNWKRMMKRRKMSLSPRSPRRLRLSPQPQP
jgi:hypothetical protein